MIDRVSGSRPGRQAPAIAAPSSTDDLTPAQRFSRWADNFSLQSLDRDPILRREQVAQISYHLRHLATLDPSLTESVEAAIAHLEPIPSIV